MPADIELHEFLAGLFHVLAFRGHRRLPIAPGILEKGLIDTMDLLGKHAKREKVRLAFRVTPDAFSKPRSQLRSVFRRLEREGVIRLHTGPSPVVELLLTPDAAYAELRTTPLPLGFLERASKMLYRQLQVGNIRHSLSRLAQRPRPARRG